MTVAAASVMKNLAQDRNMRDRRISGTNSQSLKCVYRLVVYICKCIHRLALPKVYFGKNRCFYLASKDDGLNPL